MRIFRELDTGRIIPEYDLHTEWCEWIDQADPDMSLESFEEWLFLSQQQNGGELKMIGHTTDLSKKIYAEYYCTDTDEVMTVMELYKYYLIGNHIYDTFSQYLNWCDCLIPIMYE